MSRTYFTFYIAFLFITILSCKSNTPNTNEPVSPQNKARTWGGEMIRIKNDNMKQVISFEREKANDKVITIVNFSNAPAKATLETQYDKRTYRELFTNKDYTFTGNDRFDLAPWSYLVLVKRL